MRSSLLNECHYRWCIHRSLTEPLCELQFCEANDEELKLFESKRKKELRDASADRR